MHIIRSLGNIYADDNIVYDSTSVSEQKLATYISKDLEHIVH